VKKGVEKSEKGGRDSNFRRKDKEKGTPTGGKRPKRRD